MIVYILTTSGEPEEATKEIQAGVCRVFNDDEAAKKAADFELGEGTMAHVWRCELSLHAAPSIRVVSL